MPLWWRSGFIYVIKKFMKYKGDLIMKVQELVELATNNKNKLLKTEQLSEVIKKAIAVKGYMGIKQKKELINNIIDDCILYEDGMYKFDDIEKYICFTMKIIEAYTNLELSDDIEEDYDTLCGANILELVLNTFKKEYDDVSILLQMKCEYILSQNTIEAQIGQFLNELLDKTDGLVGVLADKVKDFDISNLPISKDDLKKLMKFINL